jgi:hypothetical protein
MDANALDIGVALKDRYELLARTGSDGGVGVYDAIDKHLSRPVIVRAFSPLAPSASRAAVARALEALVRINHPGVIKPLDWGDVGEDVFVVLERPDGVPVRGLIASGRPAITRAASILRKASQALAAAHDRGVVHARLNPANIIVRDFEDREETVALCDFDLGCWGPDAGRTPDAAAYMAPETIQGAGTSARADIFALGAIAYEMVTGRRAFEAADGAELLAAQLAGPRMLPRSLSPDLPEDAERVILRALAFDPGERPARATAFGDELHRSVLLSRGNDNLQEAPTMEIAHLLIVKADGPVIQQQPERRLKWDRTIRSTRVFQDARARNELMEMLTADGVALAFFRGRPNAFVDAAVEIADAFRGAADIKARMALHSGPVYRVEHTIAGPAYSLADQIARRAGADQILVSNAAADLLQQLGQASDLHEVGETVLDASTDPIRLFNLYNERIGSSAPIRGARRRSDGGRRLKGKSTDGTLRTRPADAVVQAPQLPATASPAASVGAPASGEGLATQVLAVSHSRDEKTEGLLYAPGFTDDRVFVPVDMDRLQQDIDRVRERVRALTVLALACVDRRDLGIEDVAGELALRALPSQGLGDLVRAHPQLDLLPDPASRIPWEAFEEIYYGCVRCGARDSAVSRDLSKRQHCQSCGTEMVLGGGKLVLSKHLTHVVRGHARAPSGSNRFLFIEDPTEDLLNNDRDGVCASHLEELHAIAEWLGFTVDIVAGPNARVDTVRRKLSDSDLGGVYYFGHGRSPARGGEGFLVLRDGKLFASQIIEAAPVQTLAFINACESADAGTEWDLSGKARGVAQAFARGRRRVVIAPYWPVVNVQAAQMALWFFRSVLSPSVSPEHTAQQRQQPAPPADIPLAEALRRARELSHARYKAGEPHPDGCCIAISATPMRPSANSSRERRRPPALVDCGQPTEN